MIRKDWWVVDTSPNEIRFICFASIVRGKVEVGDIYHQNCTYQGSSPGPMS